MSDDAVRSSTTTSRGRSSIMSKYRKKSVEIEAVQWDGNNIDEILEFVDADDRWKNRIELKYVEGGPVIGSPAFSILQIPTPEGIMTAQRGDWIIRGVLGELYPCKPDFFDAT